MRFERFLLDDYLKTDSGKEIFNFFDNLKNIFEHDFNKFKKVVGKNLLDLDGVDYYFSDDSVVSAIKDSISIKKFRSYEEFEECCSDPDNFYGYISDKPQAEIPLFSLAWFLAYPDYAFPYLLPEHFFILQEICDLFGISIPNIPGKNKHFDRYRYYFFLCRTFRDFRRQHNLTPIEFCIFIYGFAIRFVDRNNYNSVELPNANNVYIVGGNQQSAEYAFECAEKGIPCIWSNGEMMSPGDIVLMYEMAPKSSIIAVWRCRIKGFDDPFNYYYGKSILDYPVIIPPIHFKKLKQSKIWGQKGLVRANMQGICGNICTLEEYEEFKKLIQEENSAFDISVLPNPPKYSQYGRTDLVLERDIEEKLLEPLLTNLGYSVKTDFKRQYPIRMGRGIRYYPDYALHATGSNGSEKADFVWEAKYRIPSKKQLFEDFGQVKSYALRLSCFGLGLVSLEGIWLSFADTQFSIKSLESNYFSWENLENPQTIEKLKKLLLSHKKDNR